MVRLTTNGQKLKRKKYIHMLCFVIILLLINIAAQYFYTRFDFTKEKRYTLNQKTKETLQKANQDITITVFLDGELPAAFKRLRSSVKDMLSDYRAFTGREVKIVFKDPLANVEANDQDAVINELVGIGIKPVAVNIKNDAGLMQKLIFPMALIEYGNRQIPVNLLLKTGGAAKDYEENITSSIQNLEYTFTSAIRRLLKGSSPIVAITEGNGEPSNLFLSDAIQSLSQQYYVGRVDLSLINKEGLDSLQVLIIAKPTKPFTEAEKYKINYFVMKGGRLVWSIDQVNAELDSLQAKGQVMAHGNKLNLDDMLFEYGVRINANLITDLNCAFIPVATGLQGQQTQIDVAPWIYYPILLPDTSSQLVKKLDGIRTQFTSTLDTINVPYVKKTAILYTSPYHKVFEVPKVLSLEILAVEPQQKDYFNSPKMGAVLLEGNFKSVFSNRPIPEGITENYKVPLSSKPTKMVVIGDGDIFLNQVSQTDQTPFPLGYDRYTQQNFGNKALLLNIADYFTDEDNLISLRNKEVNVRLLDKIRLKNEKVKWQLINTIGPLLVLICFAIFQHYYRKYKYAK